MRAADFTSVFTYVNQIHLVEQVSGRYASLQSRGIQNACMARRKLVVMAAHRLLEGVATNERS
jgi:hypothetical protein